MSCKNTQQHSLADSLIVEHKGLGKARYLGLERNKTKAMLIAMSHNLKTGMNIFKQMRSLHDYCV
jgi:IS5 family transposase